MTYSLRESIKRCQKEVDEKLEELKKEEEKKKKEKIRKIIDEAYSRDMKKLELILKALDIVLEKSEDKYYDEFQKKVEQGTVTLEDIKLFSKKAI